ncbi:hypothetical protein BGZ72_009596 [Mortierella alpina]|nr:hypothetical protein BGZ72_009596 [Mortierella alpina]
MSSPLSIAYSRVRMTLAETHTPNPLDTMTEYWHALSASRPQEQEQEQVHRLKGDEIEEDSSAGCTNTKSRTSINRLLDSVLDSATTLTDSKDAHVSYSEKERNERAASQSPTTCTPDIKSTRPQLQREPTSKLKFFVCDEDEDEDDEESEDEASAAVAMMRSAPLRNKATGLIRQAEVHRVRYEGLDAQDLEAQDSHEDEGYCFDTRTPIATFTSPSLRSEVLSPQHHVSAPAALERRQSLLSNLLQAEKQQRRQETQSNRSSNSDSEPQIYPSHQHQKQQQQQYPSLQYLECNRFSRDRSAGQHETTANPRSPLVRTRKVYKNLDELALVATAAIPAAASPLHAPSTRPSPAASSMSSNAAVAMPAPARGTAMTKASAVAGWSRSHVQVQIQSLMVQSTSTAQRALLNASSTLTDVLFRAAK